MKWILIIMSWIFISIVLLSGCTPLLIGGAAAGGAAGGYILRNEGYKINISKEIKGQTKSQPNSTAPLNETTNSTNVATPTQ